MFGQDAVIRTLLEHDPPPSTILFGPPGCGKTTIAQIISHHTRCPFRSLSCCTSGVQDIKTIADQAENEYRLRHLPTILFMDEIHRFNKKQQDIFLPSIESGKLILIGATTENPSFSLNKVQKSGLFSQTGAAFALSRNRAEAAESLRYSPHSLARPRRGLLHPEERRSPAGMRRI